MHVSSGGDSTEDMWDGGSNQGGEDEAMGEQTGCPATSVLPCWDPPLLTFQGLSLEAVVAVKNQNCS